MNNLKRIVILGTLLFSSMGFAKDHIVEIQGFEFVPGEISVAPGDKVIFINKDRAPHSVRARPESAQQFEESRILNTGDEFELSVDDSDVSAHCGVHVNMPGIEITVVVEDRAQQLIDSIRADIDELEMVLQNE